MSVSTLAVLLLLDALSHSCSSSASIMAASLKEPLRVLKGKKEQSINGTDRKK